MRKAFAVMLVVLATAFAFADGPIPLCPEWVQYCPRVVEVPAAPQDGPMPLCINHPGKPPCPQVR